MAMIPMEYDQDLLYKKVHNVPSIAISAGTVGTWVSTTNIDVSEAGYTPIQACFQSIGHPASYLPILRLGSTYAYVSVYRVITSAYTIPANDITIEVLYKKN